MMSDNSFIITEDGYLKGATVTIDDEEYDVEKIYTPYDIKVLDSDTMEKWYKELGISFTDRDNMIFLEVVKKDDAYVKRFYAVKNIHPVSVNRHVEPDEKEFNFTFTAAKMPARPEISEHSAKLLESMKAIEKIPKEFVHTGVVNSKTTQSYI